MRYKELLIIRERVREQIRNGETNITLMSKNLGYTREEFNPIIDEMLIKDLAHIELKNNRPILVWC